jgi:TolB-like protein/DNA-binding winged helix-turn-helix (wHTH) protein/tetratricopeptide (TPR) repeat protein
MAEQHSKTTRRWRIDDLVLDAGTRELRRGETLIDLPKLSFDLLLELARAAPNVLTVDELMDRVWAGVVVSPTTVAKRVELLRHALDDDSKSPRYVALVRGLGYRLVADAARLPDETGMKTHRSAAESSSATAAGATVDGRTVGSVRSASAYPRARVLTVATIVAVAAVGLAFLAQRDDAAAPGPPNSIAVLPFISLNTAIEDEHFADGLTEELSHVLANIEGLQVTGRTSAFQFKGKGEDLRRIGEALGVTHVLEGSVRRGDNEMRITAQLVSTTSGFHLWSKTYDRSAMDALAIQQDIARNVAAKLRRTLMDQDFPPSVDPPATDPETYTIYLRARGLFEGPTSDWGEAQRLLETVVERDPEFGPGWIWLARVEAIRVLSNEETYQLGWREGWQRISAAAQKARLMAPETAGTYAVLGRVAWLAEGDDAKAARLLSRALELEPANLRVLSLGITFAQLIGRLDEAIAMGEFVVSRDPMCGDCQFRLARSYEYAGELEKAGERFEIMRAVDGGGYEWSLGTVWLLQGDTEAALASYRSLDHHLYLRLQGEAMALHDLGRAEESAAKLDQLESEWGDRQPIHVAMAYAYTEQTDKAFEWIGRSLEHHRPDLRTEFLRPLFWKLHDDPRWEANLRRVGRAPDQLAAIEFEVRVPEDPVYVGG